MNQKENNIYSTLKRIILENVELAGNLENLDTEVAFIELGINSVLLFKIVVAIESEFKFEFEDEDLDANKFPTVKSLISYIEVKI